MAKMRPAWCDQNLSNHAVTYAFTVLVSTTELGRLIQMFTIHAEKQKLNLTLTLILTLVIGYQSLALLWCEQVQKSICAKVVSCQWELFITLIVCKNTSDISDWAKAELLAFLWNDLTQTCSKYITVSDALQPAQQWLAACEECILKRWYDVIM